MSSRTLLALTWIFVAQGYVSAASAGRADDLWFNKVEPLLDRSCFKCHGGVRQKSGLDLRSLQKILEGGERGPAIVPGKAEESRLFQFVLKDSDPHMPQDERKQLAPQEIDLLRDWINVLPATNIISGLGAGDATWVQTYLRALSALDKPIWVPPAHLSMHEVIDGFIELGWKQHAVRPSPLCDDRVFVRRAYLDLCGRIPALSELETFLYDGRLNKRALLVDALLASKEYSVHMRELFDVILMGRRDEGGETRRRDHGWFGYLEHAFGDNYSWDRIIRDVILARPSNPEDRGAMWYLYERRDNYQAMAEAVAPVVFGVEIGCAQCHNHPLAAEVEQRHYWGLVAAFNRGKNVESKDGAGVAESAIGGFISFANLKKESQPALLAFLNGTVVSEQRPKDGEKESDSPDKYVVPPPAAKDKPEHPAVPRFSRRQALAEAATTGNPQLARFFVNRLWAIWLGRGLVNPVDQLDALHRPNHPDLFHWLAADFEQHGYDIKRLVREIMLSRVYQLDSRWLGSSDPSPDLFARGLEKPLTAEQLYHSVLVATGTVPSPDGKVSGHDEAELRHSFIREFPDVGAPDYNATLQQAMFLTNSRLLDELLQPKDGNLLSRLVALSSAEDRVSLSFRTVLGRAPDRDELDRCKALLEARAPDLGARELVWALLTESEFQLNH
jgi:hypothetical protein